MPLVHLAASRLLDWDSFHSVFAEAFGFPDFYGRNMDAWIDCMTSLDSPAERMTTVHGSASDPVVLRLEHADAMPNDLFDALVDATAYVNWRRLADGRPAILMLAFSRLTVDRPHFFTRATPERRTVRGLRRLLEGIEPGGALPDTSSLLMVTQSLEHLLPPMLAKVYPYWMVESLDGFYLADATKLAHDQVELKGVCVLISDQGITPFQLQMQLSPVADEIGWMQCHLGKRGDGPGNMARIPWSAWNGRTKEVLQEPLERIDWTYTITVGEKRVV